MITDLVINRLQEDLPVATSNLDSSNLDRLINYKVQNSQPKKGFKINP